MRIALWLVYLAVWSALPAGAQVLVDTQFGVDCRPVAVYDNRAGETRVTGSLPKGWQDNSGWARVWAKYAPVEENGERFLRVSVSKVQNGRTCLCYHPLPDIADEGFFRLSVKLRSAGRMMAVLGMRVVPSPYTLLWSGTCYPSAREWEERTYTFRVGKNKQPIGFWIYLDGLGQTDLHSLRLERVTREEALADLKARYPGEAPRNLLRNTRLPLGLQSGWSISRNISQGDDIELAPDPKVPGPSGSPSLRVRTDRRVALFTEPFAPALAPDRHTASFHIRGTGEGALHVLAYTSPDPDYRVVGHDKFDLGKDADWRRVEVPFTPLPFVPLGSLRFILEPGTYWLDALQVERGDKATPYAPQRTCEVALAFPEGPASLARVQFSDEPARVRFAVTGSPTGATLSAQAVNLYEETIPLPAVALDGRSLQSGLLSYEEAARRRPRGIWRVEAWVEDGKGQRISPPNEIVIHRLHRPRYWMKDAPDSPFGVHTYATTRHNLMAKAVGANWVRLHGPGSASTDWFALEPKRGEWVFDDETVRRFRKHHLKILANLQTAPRWASYYDEFNPGKSSGEFTWSMAFTPPKDLDAFAGYVRTLVSRYKGLIDDYEFWNEPYWFRMWDRCVYPAAKDEPEAPPAFASYARLMRAAYESAHAAHPGVRFIGFCSNITPDREGAPFSGSEWMSGVTAAGGVKWCDGVSFHHYEPSAPFGFQGDNIDMGVGVITEPLVKRHGRVPRELWMTEGSPLLFTPLANAGFYHHTLPGEAPSVDFAAPGDRLARYTISLLAHGVKKVFLYSMHCHSSLLYGKQDYNDIVTTEGYLNLAGAAYAAATWHLEDTRFVKTLPLGEGVIAHLFEAQGRAIAAVLPHPAGHAAYAVPRSKEIAAEDLFGNPLPPGAPLEQTVVYLTTNASAARLESLLLSLPGRGGRPSGRPGLSLLPKGQRLPHR